MESDEKEIIRILTGIFSENRKNSSAFVSSEFSICVGPGSDDCAVTTLPLNSVSASSASFASASFGSVPASVSESSHPVMVSTTDMLHRKTDFPDRMSYYDIGWMSAAVNLSDVASMGAKPSALLFFMGLPKDLSLSRLKEIAQGIRDCSHMYGAEIIGGDTDVHDELTIAGTAFGFVDSGKVLKRNGAKPGDLVCITGIAGAAGIALDHILPEISKDFQKIPGNPDISEKADLHLFRPCPRVFEAVALSESGIVTSMMDTSDGLASSLYEIAKQSDVGFEIDESSLPLPENLIISADSENMQIHDYEIKKALYDGGDFELLFTIHSDDNSLRRFREISDSFEKFEPHLSGNGENPDVSHKYPVRFSVIGRVTESEKGIVLVKGNDLVKENDGEKCAEVIKKDGYSAFQKVE